MQNPQTISGRGFWLYAVQRHQALEGFGAIAELPESYYYSSATFYEYGVDDFKMLTHYKD